MSKFFSVIFAIFVIFVTSMAYADNDHGRGKDGHGNNSHGRREWQDNNTQQQHKKKEHRIYHEKNVTINRNVYNAPPQWYNKDNYNSGWYRGRPHWRNDNQYWANRNCEEFWHNGRYVRRCYANNNQQYYIPQYENNHMFWFQIPGLTIGID